MLAGASPAGWALCGAAADRSGGTLTLFDANSPAGSTVLVVDAITVSGISARLKQDEMASLGFAAEVYVAGTLPADGADPAITRHLSETIGRGR